MRHALSIEKGKKGSVPDNQLEQVHALIKQYEEANVGPKKILADMDREMVPYKLAKEESDEMFKFS